MVYQVKDKADLDNQLAEAGEKLVIVDFFATWCGPCKMVAPKFEEMSAEMSNVVFVKVDVDEAEDLAIAYEVSAMPTFVFIKNGEKVESFSGANVAKLREIITKHA